METPSSVRRVTRSQTMASANSNSNSNLPMSRKIEESEKGVSKSRQRNVNQQDRSALIDITNDSPIVGLAMGSLKTPSSSSSSTISKKRINCQAKQTTPGSGEALLRGQVKTLLQKVEEEAELSKLSFENHQPFLHLVNSPIGLLAPTPANTPHVLNLAAGNEESFKNSCLALATPSPVQEQIEISQMVADMLDGYKQEGLEYEKSFITRSLLLDFSDKSEGSELSDCCSVLTFKGLEIGTNTEKSRTEDDDDDSVWSIQVNASSRDEEEEEEDIIEEVGEDYDDFVKVEEGDGGLVDELCEGMSKISVNGGERKMVKFAGKHMRFVYDSDGELEGQEEEEECDGESEVSSSSSLLGDGGLVDELCEGMSKISVNGGERKMVKFVGKHVRFVYDSDGELEGEEEEEECDGESEVSSSSSLLGVLCLKGLPTPKGKHFRFPQDLEEDQ